MRFRKALKSGFALSLIVALWWFVAELGVISSLYLPHPLALARAFNSKLLVGALVSLTRAGSGFLAGVFLAYLIHFLAIRFDVLDTLDPQFAASRAIPAIALMPLFLLWFGFGEGGRVAMVALTALLFFIAPLQAAFKYMPREWSLVAEQVGASTLSYYWRIVIPGTLAQLVGSYRLTFAISFTVAIASDYIGSQAGIGKFIDTARVTFNIPAIFLAVFVAAFVGLSIDKLMVWSLDRVIHWGGRTSKV